MSELQLTNKVSDSSSEEVEVDDVTTDWRAVIMAGIITFLAAVENTVIGMSEWPYMDKIDDEATSQFFGFVSSISKFGHAVFALVFSYWSYRTQKVRFSLILGRVIAFLACCIYLSVEFFPVGRRYLMLFCYFLFGVASSSSTVLRVYIVRVSSQADRSRAFSLVVLANMVSIVVGPVVQLCFIHISYPGFEIINNVYFHIYSAPIWIASVTNFISIAVIYIYLRELPKKTHIEIFEDVSTALHRHWNVPENSSFFTLEGFKTSLGRLMNVKLAWALVFLCWFQKVVAQLAVVTLQTTAAPMMMVSFGWDGTILVQVQAIAMAIVGLLSFLVAGSFMAGLDRVCSPRSAFLIALLISVAMYVLSYPYADDSRKLPKYNETSKAGCNPSEYDWCETEHATSAYLFLPIIVTVMGVGLPLAGISLDTIYSKILGSIDQTIMQGAIVAAEDLILILGPLYTASVYSSYGQGWLWICNALVTLVGCALWIVYYPRMASYK